MQKEILGTMMNDGCEASGTILYLLFCFHFLSKLSRVNHLRVQFWEIDPRFFRHCFLFCVLIGGNPSEKLTQACGKIRNEKVLAQQVGFVALFAVE